MDGDIRISRHRLNYFFAQRQVRAQAFTVIGRGSFGAVFRGVFQDVPVVIKVALSDPDANHTLKDEMEMYKQLGQYCPMDTSRLPRPDDGTGLVYYYASEQLNRKDDLKWHRHDGPEKQVQHHRPEHCIEQEGLSSHTHELFGYCTHTRCKSCMSRKAILHVLVMSCFGESLRELQKTIYKQRTFTVPTVAKLMVTAILKLKWIHDRGLVHRDLKPNNMVIPAMASDPSTANLYFIDLGLSKPWRTKSGHHIGYHKGHSHTGTIYYLGVHAHDGHEASRRDDLQALGVIAMDMLTGELPWEQHRRLYDQAKGSKSSSRRSVRKLKRQRDQNMLQEKLDYLKHLDQHLGLDKSVSAGHSYGHAVPKEFAEFLRYTHSLEFCADPDYGYWIDKFVRLIDKQHWIERPVDWSSRLMVPSKADAVADAKTSSETSSKSSSHRHNGHKHHHGHGHSRSDQGGSARASSQDDMEEEQNGSGDSSSGSQEHVEFSQNGHGGNDKGGEDKGHSNNSSSRGPYCHYHRRRHRTPKYREPEQEEEAKQAEPRDALQVQPHSIPRRRGHTRNPQQQPQVMPAFFQGLRDFHPHQWVQMLYDLSSAYQC